jgi:regulator of Ty1 transposition protein 109
MVGGGGRQLSDVLSSSIPSSHPHKYRVHYLLSPPSKHASLYLSQQPPKITQKSTKSLSNTTCQHHLLLLSHESKFIYAIEVLIYRTQTTQIIYISKADTTGYAPSSITRPVTTAFLQYLVAYAGGGTIQLFARSQPQYIFPFSATNGRKHILDDTQLIKWWLRVLSPLNGKGKVYIPGVDKYKIQSYYPSASKWECAPPGLQSEGDMGVLARDVVPVFPDDPKARFLHDLKGDGQLSTTTLGQFWELMEHRQECSSGRLVGFISMVCEQDKSDMEDGVVVEEKVFLRAYEMILNGDYSSVEATSGATKKWIQSIAAIIPDEMKEKWGFDLIPSGKETEKLEASVSGAKRPAEEVKAVNMLGGTLVRKKPKT